MRVDHPVQRHSGADLWNVLLGVAVIVLTATSTYGWTEIRALNDRLERLEHSDGGRDGSQVAEVAPAAGSIDDQFTSLRATVTTRDAAFRGDPAASVVLLEFSDFECPFCARHFSSTYKRVIEQYVATRKIKYVFRHLPLEEIHAKAFLAAEVAECSRRQGVFWDVHDQFFSRQRTLQEGDLRRIAVSAGADAGRLDECVDASARDQVLRDVTDARNLGAAGTPLFLAGRAISNEMMQASYSISGARSFDVFQLVLDRLLASRK